MKKSIMFVDDEKLILKSLERLYMGGAYETSFVTSGEAALAFLENNHVDMIVTDIHMPGMTGFELLKIVKDRYPSIIRIALSGYAESNAILKSLEENVAKMYILKPWDNRELRSVIDNAFSLEEVLNDRNIFDLINNMSDLPTMPMIYNRIKKMIHDDEDVEKIGNVIESDQASSAKILRIANSAFYGAKTGAISQAIMFLGLMNVKSIVLSNALFRLDGSNSELIKVLWNHSTLTNRYTSMIYQRFLGKKIPNIYASAGLLHNIGMTVLLAYNPRLAKVSKDTVSDMQLLLNEVQTDMGITHPELGAYLLNWWEIPLPIVEAALYHMNPMHDKIINKELVCVVHIARANAWRKIAQEFVEETQEDGCYTCLGLDRRKVEACFGQFEEPMVCEDDR